MFLLIPLSDAIFVPFLSQSLLVLIHNECRKSSFPVVVAYRLVLCDVLVFESSLPPLGRAGVQRTESFAHNVDKSSCRQALLKGKGPWRVQDAVPGRVHKGREPFVYIALQYQRFFIIDKPAMTSSTIIIKYMIDIQHKTIINSITTATSIANN